MQDYMKVVCSELHICRNFAA